jgi:hypothetical protein
LPAGHYFLDLTFPGRIVTFKTESQDLNPADFEVKPGLSPLRIVVSLKTAPLSVDVQGLPDAVTPGSITAILYPDDSYLALNRSGFMSPVTQPHLDFGVLTPGKYLLFIVDGRYVKDLVDRDELRKALRDRAASVEVVANGESRFAAARIDSVIVQEAVDQLPAKPKSGERELTR